MNESFKKQNKNKIMLSLLAVVLLIIVMFFCLLFFLSVKEESIVKQYEDEEIRIKYFTDNKIALNEIAEFLLENQNVEEIRKSKSCYQNNCTEVDDYIVIGDYNGDNNVIIDKMSKINLKSAYKILDDNKEPLYIMVSLVQTHRYFIGYKKCVNESCTIKDDYHEKVMSKKTFYHKEKKINDEWSTIYSDIPFN